MAAEATVREIDIAVRNLVEEADHKAQAVLQKRIADLHAGVARFL